ncbi:MAG TPA: GNAT family N-acetyltransferase [Thermoanaerobaculia bacterium]|jgi:RimJ/RimL family protein N-acetyltransferase|nr:GNAT family N-acetyltransferase [Thermoanaerobaculia bacterium]
MIEIPTLETERLLLRPFRQSDIDDYAALNADPEVLRYLSSGDPWERERAWRHMAFLLGHWQLVGAGMWAVEQRESRTFVGMVGFAQPEGWAGFELAWTLVRRWWGYGYATEGARAALHYAFTVLKRDRVISLIHPENQASILVAERLGEILQGHSDLKGTDYLVYGIDREGYAAQVETARSIMSPLPGGSPHLHSRHPARSGSA